MNADVTAPRGFEWSRCSLTRQVYRYLQDRADQVPSIREICAATRAIYATLERGFRNGPSCRVWGCTDGNVSAVQL